MWKYAHLQAVWILAPSARLCEKLLPMWVITQLYINHKSSELYCTLIYECYIFLGTSWKYFHKATLSGLCHGDI
jgi:hypothetical protein